MVTAVNGACVERHGTASRDLSLSLPQARIHPGRYVLVGELRPEQVSTSPKCSGRPGKLNAWQIVRRRQTSVVLEVADPERDASVAAKQRIR